jgi:sialate O-acetylesterase
VRLIGQIGMIGLSSRATKLLCSAGLMALVLCATASAEVRLPNIFSDHAVLQRGQPVRVWGWAAPAESVNVRFHDQSQTVTADAIGAWEVWLMPEHAGGPYVLSVTGSQTEKPIERVDILVGDVWVASGQSNMVFPLSGFAGAPLKDGDQEIASASQSRIRLLLVMRAVSLYPLDDITGSWTACTPDTAKDFSAVAYFFGREIAAKEGVPIGLIDSAWGGTSALSWVSFEGLGSNDLSASLRDGAVFMHELARINERIENLTAQEPSLRNQGKPVPQYDHDMDQGSHAPAALFNSMIAPLTRYAIKGVIWYQGESDGNPQMASNYARMFSALITDWRHQWGEGDFPFLFVQISSHNHNDDGWGQVRDAQRRTLALRNTGMAVSLDVGESANIHPANKQAVGKRLAIEARRIAYGETGTPAAPEFVQISVEGGAIRVWLKNAEGLTARDGQMGDFELAAADHNFKPAEAKIETVDGETAIVVSAATVSVPRYVRYGWANVVTHYIYNSAGLPLGTFTSE